MFIATSENPFLNYDVYRGHAYAQEGQGKVKYYGETDPVQGKTATALQCVANKCAPNGTLAVTGGQEKTRPDGSLYHSKNSVHYPENGGRGVDLSSWRDSNQSLTFEQLKVCAVQCGFTHGMVESRYYPHIDMTVRHYHFQIGSGNGAPKL